MDGFGNPMTVQKPHDESMETTRLIELKVGCRKCLRPWILTHRDVRAGTWQTCPACRAVKIEEAA
jgi:hypothetical protein